MSGTMLTCWKFLILYIFNKVANFHKQNNRHLSLTPHLKKHRESNTLLLMELVVFVDEGDVMLVQFTSSLVVLLGWHYEVCGSTPTVSQTQLAAWHQTLTLKLFNNVVQESFIFPCCEVCSARRWWFFFGGKSRKVRYPFKDDKEENVFNLHH